MPFWKKKSTPPPKSDDVMVALTFKEVLAHARLEHHARHLAIKGEPPQHHIGLTLPENDTVDLIERRMAIRAGELDAQVTALGQELQMMGPNPDHDAPIVQQRAIDAMAGVYTARAPQIKQARAAEKTASAQLSAWRDEHHVARPAQYPRSRLVHFRWLLAILGIETIAQASMLLPATPDGLIGAVGLGLAVSALTTGLGLAIGFGALRYIAAPGTTKKSLGFVALPVLGSLLLFIAIYVAHYRHLAGAASDAPNDAQVMEHLLSQPLDLSSQGVLLLLISLACAAFAAWKGYTASDPIPGYEAVDRAYVDARDDVDYLRDDIRGAIGAIRARSVTPLLSQPKIARAKGDHLKAVHAALQNKRERIAVLDRQEAALAQRAIGQFRRLNLATRADGVTPDYFAERIVIAGEVPQLPANIEALIAEATAQAMGDAAKAAELALHVARMLDRAADCTDEIMVKVERSSATPDGNAALALRASLETTLAAGASLPRPPDHAALPDGTSRAT